LAYRWFCKLNLEDKVLDHSSITRIWDRFGLEVFQSFFNKVIDLCKQQGLVKSGAVMTDGTLIEANASLDSLTKIEVAQCKDNKIVALENKQSKRKISNKTHISITNPDATLAFKRGKSQTLKYKAHMTIDAESRVILDTKITTGACHDSQVYLEQLQNVAETHEVKIKKAIADRAYGSGEILQSLINDNIEPIIPLFNSKNGSIVGEKDGFIYEEENDRYRCLAGNYLTPFSSRLDDGRMGYRISGRICKHCPIQHTCKANVMKHHMRLIRRHPHQKLFEEIILKMKTKDFRQKMSERFWKMEAPLANRKIEIVYRVPNTEGWQRCNFKLI